MAALFNDSRGIRSTVQWLIINVAACFAVFSAVALAQFEWSEAVSGSVSFPDVGLTCIGNLAVFCTALIRGRLDLENGARDVLATSRGPELNDINNGNNGFGLSTSKYPSALHVVMLSSDIPKPHSSIVQFMKYIEKCHSVHSVLLQTLFFKPDEACRCSRTNCSCIAFWTTEEITKKLARQLPGTLKRLSDTQWLLPCQICLRNGCHGCNQGLLYVEDVTESSSSKPKRLIEGDRNVQFPNAACEMLDYYDYRNKIDGGHGIMCIPVRQGDNDRWTQFLIKFLKSKDMEARGLKVRASEALANYIGPSSREWPLITEFYSTASLIVPRFAEVFMNIALTVWLRVDGFSSSLVARRAIRDYLVDAKGSGFAANAFLTQAKVKCDSRNKTNVCLLKFRSGLLSVRSVSYTVGCVNLLCSITWIVLIAFEGKWYGTHSTSPSTPRVAIILGAIVIALGMDSLNLCTDRFYSDEKIWVWGGVVTEVGCIVICSVFLGMKKGLGRWLYSIIQVLVWLKWGIGCLLLGDHNWEEFYAQNEIDEIELTGETFRADGSRGTLIYCSAFLVNAILAGVRGTWTFNM